MAEGIGIGVFILLWFVLVFGGMALWIVSIVEIAKVPDHVYRMLGKEKLTWILIVVLASWIGALIWWFGPRKEVKAAAAANPMPPPFAAGPPPGWYPDPQGAPGQAWWDGTRWTGHRQ